MNSDTWNRVEIYSRRLIWLSFGMFFCGVIGVFELLTGIGISKGSGEITGYAGGILVIIFYIISEYARRKRA